MQHAMPHPSTSDGASAPSPARTPALVDCVNASTQLAMSALGLPFDMARAQYARAVQAGLIERSMLASRDFARALGALERFTLGPWARRV